jgi:hypothetical protein
MSGSLIIVAKSKQFENHPESTQKDLAIVVESLSQCDSDISRLKTEVRAVGKLRHAVWTLKMYPGVWWTH